MAKMKKCTGECKKEYPSTREYFYRAKRNKDGLECSCKKCRNKVQKKYRQSEKGKIVCRAYRQTEKGKAARNQAIKKHRFTIKGRLTEVYCSIRKRCNNPNTINYKDYGGRGIQNRFASLNKFRDYVVNVLQIDPRGLQIDRINNNGHYEPGNIRFVTVKENANNRRNSKNCGTK